MVPEALRCAVLDRGIELEQATLGVILNGEERSALPSMEGYPWTEIAHEAIYRAICKLRSAGKPAHPSAVHALMPHGECGSYREMGGTRYLGQLVQAAPFMVGVAAEESHLELLRQRASKVRLSDLASELQELSGNPELSAPEALGRVWDKLDAIRTGGVGAPITYRELVRSKVERLKRPAAVYSTGLPEMDLVMQGGMWPSKLYGVAAKRKHGKSLMLGTIALNLANAGVKTLYVTLEQGPDEVTDRMAASELGVNAIHFLKGENPSLSAKVARYAETAPDCLLFEDRAGLSFNELRSMVGRYAAREEIKVFILDYWQLVQGQERGETEAGHLARVAQWLADAARAHGIAILTAAQINRDGQTLGSDGLRRACSMYLHQRKVEIENSQVEQVWLEMEDTRYTPRMDVGSEENPLLYIDKIGPRIMQWGQER
jgi:replicative DNA helicase